MLYFCSSKDFSAKTFFEALLFCGINCLHESLRDSIPPVGIASVSYQQNMQCSIRITPNEAQRLGAIQVRRLLHVLRPPPHPTVIARLTRNRL
jgi:hypothetical protein